MRVPVEGELGAGMAEKVLDWLGMYAATEQEGSAGMPEIVLAYARQPRAS